jgi:hypothetical protein
MTDWPDDADGDVLRRMARHGFDFARPWTIDFNVDFAHWPPSTEALSLLIRAFPNAVVYEPSAEGEGYVQFQVNALVAYALVTRIQAEVSAWMAPFGGVCESWGVLH